MGALDALIYGVRDVFADALQLARRARLSFGPEFVVEDDGENEWTRVTLATVAPGAVTRSVKVTAINYTLDKGAGDHIIVASVNGLTLELPAAPAQGDEYEIKSAAGVSGTVIDGNGKNIAGAATYEQSAGENTVLRYAGAQWETF